MPETHDHLLIVRDDFVHPETKIRQVERQCLCGLAERRYYDGDEVVRVRYRWAPLGGGWADALEVLGFRLPVVVCGACGGTDEECEKCGGMGILEDSGEPLGPPPKPRRKK